MSFVHTTPWALYNEIDEYAADWLENLIARGLIAKGLVDRRSIEDVSPNDLRGFRQVHLFAGIGVWSYSARRAGISDDTPFWSASCPCQPFSAAGKGEGVDDERHLWPAAYHLIRERRPERIFGEQVASKDGLAWLDLVLSDMENEDYAIGALDTCSAGFGAPHIRQRLRFAAHDRRSSSSRISLSPLFRQSSRPGSETAGSRQSEFRSGDGVFVSGVAHGDGNESREGGVTRVSAGEGFWSELGGRGQSEWVDNNNKGLEGFGSRYQTEIRRLGAIRPAAEACEFGGLADNESTGWREQRQDASRRGERSREEELGQRSWSGSLRGHNQPTGPTNGFWSDADWLFCRDGKWRPVEPGTFPLAHGAPARVGRLRAYGNAVDAEATREFIQAYLEKDIIDIESDAAPLQQDPHGLNSTNSGLFEDLLG